MSRYLFALVLVFGVGCRPNAESHAEANPASADEQGADLLNGTSQDPAQDSKDDKSKLADQLQKLTASANSAEAAGDYQSASNDWSKIRTLLSREYGENAWQTVNAAMALQAANTAARMNEAQRQRLDQLRNLQKQVNSDLQGNDIGAAMSKIQTQISIADEIFGQTSHVAIKTRLRLGQFYLLTGGHDFAEKLARTAYQDCQKVLPAVHPDVDALTFLLGRIYLAQAKPEEAIPFLQTSEKISRRIYGQGSLTYSDRLAELGAALQANGKFDSALNYVKGAIAIRRQHLGNSHPVIATGLQNLGVIYMDLGNLKGARENLNQAITLFAEDPKYQNSLLDARNKLASVCLLEKDFLAAESELRKIVEAKKAVAQARPVEYASSLYRLAMALGFQGKYEQAEPIFVEALRIQSEQLGPQHPRTLKAAEGYAMLLKQTRRVVEAQQILEKYRRVATQRQGDLK